MQYLDGVCASRQRVTELDSRSQPKNYRNDIGLSGNLIEAQYRWRRSAVRLYGANGKPKPPASGDLSAISPVLQAPVIRAPSKFEISSIWHGLIILDSG